MGSVAYICGLIHDMGKMQPKFQKYLEDAYNGVNVVKGSVIHTFTAPIYILTRYHGSNDVYEKLTSEIVAYVTGAHHGLFDIQKLDKENGFDWRLSHERDDIAYEDSLELFWKECVSEDVLSELFQNATNEIRAIYQRREKENRQLQEFSFLFGQVIRLVLSAVIDGDRFDTYLFMSGKESSRFSILDDFWEKELTQFEDKLGMFTEETPINIARGHISESCKRFASNPPDIYQLSVPTGAGKTLSALRYSLAHATQYEKKRVVFVIPLLSILEQNSEVIKRYVSSKEFVLEHHSNVVIDDESEEVIDRYEMLSESWDSPYIVTTMYQFLETLFDGRTSSIRRMQALCDSIIVIDEVQSIPKKSLYLFNMAANFLKHYCNATIVLSSATQPCFEKVDFPLDTAISASMVPYDNKLFRPFQRTRIVDLRCEYGMNIDQIAMFIKERQVQYRSVLVICNTRGSAVQIYEQLQLTKESDDENVVHLSTSMCMQNRRDVMEEVNKLLMEKKKLICISTQLVEAGVDFSFENVIRVCAGVDNAIQAAGRCNRHGEYIGKTEVDIINLDHQLEKLKNLQDIKSAQNASITVLDDFRRKPEKYKNDIGGEESIGKFYEKLFHDGDVRKQFKYPVTTSGLRTSIFDLLTNNPLLRSKKTEQYILAQSFKEAGELYQVYDQNTVDVIVPYNDHARYLIGELLTVRAKFDIIYMKKLLGEIKPYVIQIYSYERSELERDKALYSDGDNRMLFLQDNWYRKDIGLTTSNYYV